MVPQPDRGPRAKAAPEAPPLPPRGLQPASRCPAAACLRPPCGDYRCTWPRLAPPRPPPGLGRLRTPTGAAERVAKAGTEGILRRRAPAEATAAGSARRRAHAREGEEEGGRPGGGAHGRCVRERARGGRSRGGERRRQRRLRSARGRRAATSAAEPRGTAAAADSRHPSSSSPPPARPSPFSFSPSPLSAGADRCRRHDPGAFPRRPSRQRPRGEPVPPLPGRD